MRNILSIDGGGIKGYIPLRILSYIEKKTNVHISDLFDYFSGVSAGSIIISLILMKNNDGSQLYNCDEIIKIFINQMQKTFTKSNVITENLNGLFGTKYNSKVYEQHLIEHFKQIKLNDLLKPCTFISYSLTTNRPYYFNSLNDPNVYLTDIIRASSAALTILDPLNFNNHILIDGGLITNNPVEICFYDASEYYNNFDPNKTFYTLSLACGFSTIDYNNDDPLKNGYLFWTDHLDKLTMSGHYGSEDYVLKIIDKFCPGNISKRINIPIGNKTIDILDISNLKILIDIMDQWISENTNMLDKICEDLLINYLNNKLST